MVQQSNRRCCFEVYVPHAAQVELAGDFTDWEGSPVAMTPCGPGWWRASVMVAPGDHLFSYLVDGRWWLPDYAAAGIQRNEFGGWVSCLAVAPGGAAGGAPSTAAADRLNKMRTQSQTEETEVERGDGGNESELGSLRFQRGRGRGAATSPSASHRAARSRPMGKEFQF